MNKAQRKNAQLERHYTALANLAKLCGVDNPEGKEIASALKSLERKAHRAALAYCNGDYNYDKFETVEKQITKQVQALFNNKLEGFFVNSDARGYALKIQYDNFRPNGKYESINLFKDWGGYGLLSPVIDGN